ncbi:MAG: VOC family protein [Psychromonas sp.]|nr:VOC family protein [Colwellia sp.]
MDITLNHTIVPAIDHVKSAQFYERIFCFKFIKEWGHFAVVKVNPTLTLDFMHEVKFSSMHYAFKVSERQFDQIFSRIKSEKIVYGSGPNTVSNGEINHNYGGRGLYFKDPNGHVLEIITTDYELD